MAYAALVQDFGSDRISVQTLPETDDHHAMRRVALRYGRSKGVACNRRNARSGLTLFLVTVDAEGVATDLDRFDGDDWRYTAGNRHVYPRRTWTTTGDGRATPAKAVAA